MAKTKTKKTIPLRFKHLLREIKKRIQKTLSSIKRYAQERSRLKPILFLSFVLGILIWLFWGIPLPPPLSSKQYPVSTKLFDRNGKLIYEIFLDKRRTPIKIDEIPQYVKTSTIAIEDKDFYKHFGFSTTGIARAAFNTVFKQKLQGGSTMTQQLVKNVLLSPERTVRRKIREFVLTLVVEAIYSKDQILETYANQIPYGSTA